MRESDEQHDRRGQARRGALLQRGALAAYQVVIDASREDDGQLVVQLQVAPTSPVEFITVTLVRSGEGLLDVLEG